MTNDSIHAPIGAKTIFNTLEPTLHEEFSSLSREGLEAIARAMAIKLLCVNECISELIGSASSQRKVLEIAQDMLDALDVSNEEHETWYAGKPREALFKLFPSLRYKGDAA